MQGEETILRVGGTVSASAVLARKGTAAFAALAGKCTVQFYQHANLLSSISIYPSFYTLPVKK